MRFVSDTIFVIGAILKSVIRVLKKGRISDPPNSLIVRRHDYKNLGG